jgi:hypothetical protein
MHSGCTHVHENDLRLAICVSGSVSESLSVSIPIRIPIPILMVPTPEIFSEQGAQWKSAGIAESVHAGAARHPVFRIRLCVLRALRGEILALSESGGPKCSMLARRPLFC